MAVCLYPISIVLYADLCRLSQTLIPLSPPLVFFGILPLLNVFSAFFTMFVFTEGTDEAKISGKAPKEADTPPSSSPWRIKKTGTAQSG